MPRQTAKANIRGRNKMNVVSGAYVTLRTFAVNRRFGEMKKSADPKRLWYVF